MMIAPIKRAVEIDTLKTCYNFALNMKAKQAWEFNNGLTTERPTKEKTRDFYVGKVAECAVYSFLIEHGVLLEPVDFIVRPGEERDDYDLESSNGMRISVKASVFGTRLLVHTGQLQWCDSDAYVCCQVPITKPHGTLVTIQGFLSEPEVVNKSNLIEGRQMHKDTLDRRKKKSLMPRYPVNVCGTKTTYHYAGTVLPWTIGKSNVLFLSDNVVAENEVLHKNFEFLVNALKRPATSVQSDTDVQE